VQPDASRVSARGNPAYAKEPVVHLAALGHVLAFPVAAAVSLKPDPNALPGMPTAEKLVDGIAAFVILGCVLGALLGIGQWVLGSRTSNYSQADSGKSKVGAAVLGAFGVGAMAAIINFFVGAGGQIK
jgi:hypothetical protein